MFRRRLEVCHIRLRQGRRCQKTGGDGGSSPAPRYELEKRADGPGEVYKRILRAPAEFAWFLGAGTSRAAGLPTATDIIWDLKRQYYCREENQEITRQDVQNSAVRDRIQSFMEAKEFPEQGADEEYSVYFEKMFGEDKERQRRYLREVYRKIG